MDRVEPGGGEEDGADAAAAFEALRAEVAALRRGVELVYRQGSQKDQEAAAPVDYSPTLGVIAKGLQGIEGRLAVIEGKPGLELTPARFEAEIRTAGHWAGEQGVSAVRMASSALAEARRELDGVLAGAREAREQRLWVGTAAVLGLMVGALLWLLAAMLLPWGMGTWLAATLMGGGQWEAGQTLMREANPTSWDRMARLYNACPKDSSTELCEAVLAVRTIPPVGLPLTQPAAPEGTRPTESVRPAPSTRSAVPAASGKIGQGR
jgi:hypothetical protein